MHPRRSGHVAFSLKDKVYVFGGYAEESPENRYPTNDLWVFDDSKWMQVQTRDTAINAAQPQQRLAAAAVNCCLKDGTEAGLLVGGWDSQEEGTGGVILQDLQALTDNNNDDVDDNDDDDNDDESNSPVWNSLSFDLEQPTSRLCAVTLPQNPKQVLVHNHRCTDHVLIVDMASNKLVQQPTSGTPPSPRGLHACAALPSTANDKIVLFGGAAQDGNMSNEVFVLDCKTWVWTKVDTSIFDDDNENQQPSPRASPCIVALNERTCLLYGGAARSDEGGLHGCSDTWLLELTENGGGCDDDDDDDNHDDEGTIRGRWTCVQQDGSAEAPPGRNAAQLTPLAAPPNGVSGGENAQYFLLSGGWYPFRTTYDDNFVLKVS
ncbi:MAG: hypothetical protein SGARI_000446 [Bacillariaceae sp.]